MLERERGSIMTLKIPIDQMERTISQIDERVEKK
jgi:hypothetical protein